MMSRIWSNLFLVAGLLLLFVGAAAVLQPTIGVIRGSLLCFVALFLLFLGVIPDLQKLSVKMLGGQITAEARNAIKDARDVAEELRQFAKFFGRETLKLIVGGGRYGGSMTAREKFLNEEAILKFLDEVGLSSKDITDVRSSVSKWHKIDYCSKIALLAQSTHHAYDKKRWDAFWQTWKRTSDRPSPTELRAFLSDNQFDDSELLDWLKDYEHFCDTGTHRRPSAYRDR